MSLAAAPTITDAFVPSRKRHIAKNVAVALLTCVILLGIAQPAEAVIVPNTKGSDFWYSVVYCSQVGNLCTVGNVRYSWSFMWDLNAHKETVQAFSALACSTLPNKAAAVGCNTLLLAYWTYIKGQLALALKYKQCLQFRYAMPPLPSLTTYRISRVTCAR